MTLSDLIKKTNYLGKENQELIKRAYELAEFAHRGSFRKSGEPFIQHPLNVALKLSDFRLDEKAIAAALLHDLPEDTNTTLKEINEKFGLEIARLVDGVSKVGKVRYRLFGSSKERQKRQIESLRKMFIVTAEDLRVVLIKLADRWHNLETLSALPEKKQKEIAKETLEIYAPLAYRLGMGELKGILEDLAFSYAEPSKYKWLNKLTLAKYETRKKYITKVKKILEKDLEKAKIKAEIHGRAKHLYSLYKKLKKYDWDLDKIYDLVALRAIVSTVSDCYATLGIIHKRWKPLIGRIKDYIALPKPNGYQSLHTTVFCEDGEIVEFQIRTKEMHEKDEYGVAAHWHYTENVRPKEYQDGAIRTERGTLADQRELQWIRDLSVWQKELKSSKEFVQTLKLDVFKDRIFVFTPRGEVIDLPEGATPIDFAYQIHTEIGDHAFAAKANGKIVPLKYELQNGEIVEIITNKKAHPSPDWLNFVKTSSARDKIKNWFKKEKKVLPKPSKVSEIVKKIVEPFKKYPSKKPEILIENEGGLKTKIALCCQPNTSSPIIGYITKDKVISIHKTTCKNILKIKSKEKFVKASWNI